MCCPLLHTDEEVDFYSMAFKDVWKYRVMFCCLVSALNSLSQCTESTVRVSHSMGHVDVKPLVMENATSIQGEVKMDVGLQAGRLILGNNVRQIGRASCRERV